MRNIMKKQYINPQSEEFFLSLENTVLAGSGDYNVTIDENGSSVDGALSNKKYPWEECEWDYEEE